MTVEYCQCKVADTFASLWDAVNNEWSDIFVHSECRLPTREVWEIYIGRCEDCMREFSFPETLYSPLSDDDEYLCEKCWLLAVGREDAAGPWMGWLWARFQRPSWYPV